MKKPFLAAALIALSASGHAVPAQAAQRTVDCLLVVDGKTYVNGPCKADFFDKEGSFTLGTSSPRPNGYFAYVNVNNDGTGTSQGYWNNGASHAHDELGTMHRAGACWQNDRAKVCAWKLGERRYFVD